MLRSLDFPIVMSVAESNGSVKSPAVINQIQSEKTYNLFIIEKKASWIFFCDLCE